MSSLHGLCSVGWLTLYRYKCKPGNLNVVLLKSTVCAISSYHVIRWLSINSWVQLSSMGRIVQLVCCALPRRTMDFLLQLMWCIRAWSWIAIVINVGTILYLAEIAKTRECQLFKSIFLAVKKITIGVVSQEDLLNSQLFSSGSFISMSTTVLEVLQVSKMAAALQKSLARNGGIIS